MQKPKVATLSLEEQKKLIEHINNNSLDNDDKQAVIELLNFYKELTAKLKSSNISLNKLREMLIGFKADKLKKILQIH